MPDFDRPLVIRTLQDPDEMILTKIVDKDNPLSLQASVDTDNNLHIENHGNDPTGTDKILKLSELGKITPDGIYHVTDNTLPGNTGIIAHERNETPNETHQIKRITGIQGSIDNTVFSIDTSIHDESGNPYTHINPLPVVMESSEGEEVINRQMTESLESIEIDPNAYVNHDFLISSGENFIIKQIWASSSGKLKIEVKFGDGTDPENFDIKFDAMNSPANPNILISMGNISPTFQGTATGLHIRITLYNYDNQALNVYSTLSGIRRS